MPAIPAIMPRNFRVLLSLFSAIALLPALPRSLLPLTLSLLPLTFTLLPPAFSPGFPAAPAPEAASAPEAAPLPAST